MQNIHEFLSTLARETKANRFINFCDVTTREIMVNGHYTSSRGTVKNDVSYTLPVGTRVYMSQWSADGLQRTGHAVCLDGMIYITLDVADLVRKEKN